MDSLFPPGPPGSTARLPQADEAERTLSESYTTTTNLAQMRWMERMRPSPDEGDPQLVLSGPSLDPDGSLSGLFATA